jgi:DNA-binding GntR family transcriptional regulator
MSYAPFFAQFNPPALAVRKHHRDLIKAIASHDGDTASKTADAYLKKGTEQFLATLRPSAS